MTRKAAALGTALLTFAALGCKKADDGGGSEAKRPLSEAEVMQLKGCAKGIDAIQDAAPEMRLMLLAEACGQGIGLGDIPSAPPSDRARLLTSKTDLICNAKAGSAAAEAPAHQKYSVLAKECGTD